MQARRRAVGCRMVLTWALFSVFVSAAIRGHRRTLRDGSVGIFSELFRNADVEYDSSFHQSARGVSRCCVFGPGEAGRQLLPRNLVQVQFSPLLVRRSLVYRRLLSDVYLL